MRSLLKTFATMMNWVMVMLGGLTIMLLLALLTLTIWERAGGSGVATAALIMTAAVAWYVGTIFKIEDKWED